MEKHSSVLQRYLMLCVGVCPFLFREAFPMVLVANKVDLVHLRKVTSDQGQEMAAKHNVSRGSLFFLIFNTVFE